MPYSIATSKERLYAVALAFWLGGALALGFVPSSMAFADWLLAHLSGTFEAWIPYLRRSVFPALSLLFYFSLPKGKSKLAEKISPKDALLSMPLPFLIAVAFGYFHPAPSVLRTEDLFKSYWLLVCIPLGEEFLFRGWMYTVSERIWPQKFFTATNPFPVAVWVSSIAFSLWHFQNYPSEPLAWVLLQVSYTFFVGMWLGFLRWRTDSLLFPIVGHFVLNLGASFY